MLSNFSSSCVGRGVRTKRLSRVSQELLASFNSSHSSKTTVRRALEGSRLADVQIPHKNIKYSLEKVGETSYDRCIAMACGGDYLRLDSFVCLFVFLCLSCYNMLMVICALLCILHMY